MQIDINSRKQLNKPENYAAFYSLLNRLPTSDRDALKESIVSQYTEGRTTSLRDMTLKEYSAAVSGHAEAGTAHLSGTAPEDSPSEAFRGTAPDAAAGYRYGRLGPGERLLPGQPYRRQGVP